MLGELRALRAGVAVPLTPKQGQLLGCLLLARGEAVGAARLCELLWGEASWRTAADRDRDRDNLHHHVVRLRDKLDPAGDARESRSPAAANGGYLLEVDDDRLDALRFTQWLREGRAAARRQGWARAAERLRAALGLWHGPRALADLRAAGWDHEGAEELDRERTAARLEVIDIEVMQLHRAHLPELEWLVGTDPTSARSTELLLRALHGRGEREAIERAYLRYSEAVTEAGWRVDADLTGLYHRMRNGEEPRGRTEERPPRNGRRGASATVAAARAAADDGSRVTCSSAGRRSWRSCTARSRTPARGTGRCCGSRAGRASASARWPRSSPARRAPSGST